MKLTEAQIETLSQFFLKLNLNSKEGVEWERKREEDWRQKYQSQENENLSTQEIKHQDKENRDKEFVKNYSTPQDEVVDATEEYPSLNQIFELAEKENQEKGLTWNQHILKRADEFEEALKKAKPHEVLPIINKYFLTERVLQKDAEIFYGESSRIGSWYKEATADVHKMSDTEKENAIAAQKFTRTDKAKGVSFGVASQEQKENLITGGMEFKYLDPQEKNSWEKFIEKLLQIFKGKKINEDSLKEALNELRVDLFMQSTQDLENIKTYGDLLGWRKERGLGNGGIEGYLKWSPEFKSEQGDARKATDEEYQAILQKEVSPDLKYITMMDLSEKRTQAAHKVVDSFKEFNKNPTQEKGTQLKDSLQAIVETGPSTRISRANSISAEEDLQQSTNTLKSFVSGSENLKRSQSTGDLSTQLQQTSDENPLQRSKSDRDLPNTSANWPPENTEKESDSISHNAFEYKSVNLGKKTLEQKLDEFINGKLGKSAGKAR